MDVAKILVGCAVNLPASCELYLPFGQVLSQPGAFYFQVGKIVIADESNCFGVYMLNQPLANKTKYNTLSKSTQISMHISMVDDLLYRLRKLIKKLNKVIYKRIPSKNIIQLLINMFDD